MIASRRIFTTLLAVAGSTVPVTSATAQSTPASAPAPAPDAVSAPAPAPAIPARGSRYVAMGSSFAAGPGLPPGAPGGFPRCGQSQINYPRIIAAQLGLDLTDRTCSGARTDHIVGPWAEVPPQIEAVTANTRLVTVTIGGNDLNYIGNLFTASCLSRVAAAQAATPATPAAGTAVSGKPAVKIPACGKLKVPTEEEYARNEAQLTEIALRIRTRAPKATIVFVQYLTPLPAQTLCPATPVRPEDAAITRVIGQRLAENTARAAQAGGAIVVDMHTLSATHTPCDPVPWMIGDPAGYNGRQGLQWHLNAAGMKATGEAVIAALKAPVQLVPAPAVPAMQVSGDKPVPAKTPAPAKAPAPQG